MKLLEIETEKIIEPKEALRVKPSDESITKLANSINKIGLINPITLRILPSGKFEIVAGHRRFLAIKSLGWKKVQANVMEDNDKIADAAKIAENMERKSLTSFEEVMAMANYAKKYELSLREFCEIFGLSKATATKYITLAEAPDDLKVALHNGTINMSAAIELMTIKDANDRMSFMKQFIEYRWNATQLKQNIELWRAQKEWYKYQEEHKEEIEAKMPHVATYITCQMCGKETPLDEIESVSVCKECREAIETVRLQTKLAQREKKAEA